MDNLIKPFAYVALRLPSDTIKVQQLIPNTSISLGKYGSFQTNDVLGRPYHLVFEILEKSTDGGRSSLRIISAEGLRAPGSEDAETGPLMQNGADLTLDGADSFENELNSDGEVVMRTNRNIVDDSTSQKLTMGDIELLKKEEKNSGQDLIARILESHSALEQKTAFALAKYALRKAKKYLRRFTVLPLDPTFLTQWILNEKEPSKIMQLREEVLSLIMTWSNVHAWGDEPLDEANPTERIGGGRWLVVDETGGLLVAAMAEKMGILFPPNENEQLTYAEATAATDTAISEESNLIDPTPEDTPPQRATTHTRKVHTAMSAQSNSITLIHANAQPNLALLKYFDFDLSNPSPSHPLYTHLKTLSWLQFVAPENDTSYKEPEFLTDNVLQSLKSGKRGNYYRKRRRWERIKSVVDEARAGGFDGLIVASVMDPSSILHHTVSCLRGAARVVVYSPNIEPLAELADLYSKTRRGAYLSTPPDPDDLPNKDFPVNPTLLLSPTIHTARVRAWQVLPGRTHPLMTAKGGAEGYVFTATRVVPATGVVEARGKFKRRKTVADDSG